GKGSQAARRGELTGLFARTTEQERRFLLGLLSGEIRQGALEGIMVEAVARAATVPASEVRRALMVAGDPGLVAGGLGRVAGASGAGGTQGLPDFRLTILRPIQPMLAQTAPDLTDALARIHPAVVGGKLDGGLSR